jgi:hypothetical protein
MSYRGFGRGILCIIYQSYIKKILSHGRTLNIPDKAFAVWHFKKVYESESVIKNANRGRDDFVAFYFNGVVLNFGFTDLEKYAIINQLFYWEIPVKTDKITGELFIV